ncbi:uncharacterized protein TNCV_3982651 [Trichonephila clavipes]|nr:uncharacterized protein TNCV_3982651 [Trichonephila clavipes]
MWLACQEFESGKAEELPCRGRGCRYTLNMLRLKHPPIGVVWKAVDGLLHNMKAGFTHPDGATTFEVIQLTLRHHSSSASLRLADNTDSAKDGSPSMKLKGSGEVSSVPEVMASILPSDKIGFKTESLSLTRGEGKRHKKGFRTSSAPEKIRLLANSMQIVNEVGTAKWKLGVWSPQTAKTAAHLFAMDAMRLSIRLWGILFHSSRSAISKSRTVAGGLGRAAMRRPRMSQTCSIGFRSGEHAGHYIRCIFSASSMFFTRRALCGRALSSWKTKESPMATA